MKRYSTMVLVISVFALLLSACGKESKPAETAASSVTPTVTSTPKPTAEPETESVIEATSVSVEEVEMPLLGEKKDAITPVEIKNMTGKTITKFAIRLRGEENEAEEMIPQGEAFLADEVRALYFELSEEDKDNENSSEGEAAETETINENLPLLPPQYDIELGFEDETTATLHTFPFEDASKVEIKFEEELAFVEYESIETSEAVSTKEFELAEKQREQDALSAAAVPEDNSQAGYVETYQEQPQYDAGSQNTGYSEPEAAPAPVEEQPAVDPNEGCLDDVIVYDEPAPAPEPAPEPAPVEQPAADPNEGCLGDVVLN